MTDASRCPSKVGCGGRHFRAYHRFDDVGSVLSPTDSTTAFAIPRCRTTPVFAARAATIPNSLITGDGPLSRQGVVDGVEDVGKFEPQDS